ncbi:hypothetical protein EDB89DRAFT_2166940 [Lactarius sanguifluus]|nr:hypothetical protein EDB89DRAFT_2166940 [Lactarius sanguifluus]
MATTTATSNDSSDDDGDDCSEDGDDNDDGDDATDGGGDGRLYYLYNFRVLSIDTDLNTSAHWGKLASDILTGKWDVALEELNMFRSTLDARAGATPLSGAAAQSQGHAEPLATLHFCRALGPTLPRRLRRSLAPCKGERGTAPVSSRVWHAIREVVKELYVEFDFEAAQHHLQLAERVVGNDFFLSELREEFLDNARCLSTNGSTLLTDLSAWLNLSPGEGEKWIVNLIRDTRLAADAKIDLEKTSQDQPSTFRYEGTMDP